MNADRQALLDLIEHLQASPEPKGFLEHLRYRALLRKAERALEWLDSRTDSKARFIWWRSGILPGAMAMYAIVIVPAILFTPLMPSRAMLLVMTGVSALLLGGLGGRAQWDANERNCEALVQQARGLLPLGAEQKLEDG
jgi:hypothetical protein